MFFQSHPEPLTHQELLQQKYYESTYENNRKETPSIIYHSVLLTPQNFRGVFISGHNTDNTAALRGAQQASVSLSETISIYESHGANPSDITENGLHTLRAQATLNNEDGLTARMTTVLSTLSPGKA